MRKGFEMQTQNKLILLNLNSDKKVFLNPGDSFTEILGLEITVDKKLNQCLVNIIDESKDISVNGHRIFEFGTLQARAILSTGDEKWVLLAHNQVYEVAQPINISDAEKVVQLSREAALTVSQERP